MYLTLIIVDYKNEKIQKSRTSLDQSQLMKVFKYNTHLNTPEILKV